MPPEPLNRTVLERNVLLLIISIALRAQGAIPTIYSFILLLKKCFNKCILPGRHYGGLLGYKNKTNIPTLMTREEEGIKQLHKYIIMTFIIMQGKSKEECGEKASLW